MSHCSNRSCEKHGPEGSVGWIAFTVESRQLMCYCEVVKQIPLVDVSTSDRSKFFPLLLAMSVRADRTLTPPAVSDFEAAQVETTRNNHSNVALSVCLPTDWRLLTDGLSECLSSAEITTRISAHQPLHRRAAMCPAKSDLRMGHPVPARPRSIERRATDIRSMTADNGNRDTNLARRSARGA